MCSKDFSNILQLLKIIGIEFILLIRKPFLVYDKFFIVNFTFFAISWYQIFQTIGNISQKKISLPALINSFVCCLIINVAIFFASISVN